MYIVLAFHKEWIRRKNGFTKEKSSLKMCRTPAIDLDLSENSIPKSQAGLESFYSMVSVISIDTTKAPALHCKSKSPRFTHGGAQAAHSRPLHGLVDQSSPLPSLPQTGQDSQELQGFWQRTCEALFVWFQHRRVWQVCFGLGGSQDSSCFSKRPRV